ncbi:MAG: GIY-YIG nuclease family protein [Bacteroidia bacterium]
MYYVYILYSEAHDRYYIGQTNNLESRLERHNKGYVKSTKAYKPWELVFSEEFDTRQQAMQRESELKRLKSKVKISELVATSR